MSSGKLGNADDINDDCTDAIMEAGALLYA